MTPKITIYKQHKNCCSVAIKNQYTVSDIYYQLFIQYNSPNRTAAIFNCLSGYLGKNLYSSNKLAIMHSNIDCSLPIITGDQ
uniref:Uncharacterized protein n=1 Tax=Rhizophora mucronata TaxID=61149 RepID=A0A2P2MSE9_RHIMU